MNMINSRRRSKTITILHTADLHLSGRRKDPADDPDSESESAFRSLEAIVDSANHNGVDLVLISGDLFDTYKPSKQVVSFVQEQFAKLAPPAILIPGNHDCLSCADAYHTHGWDETNMHPKIITQHEGETLEVPGLPLVVWGRAMVEHSPDFNPLEGLPPRNGNAWQIAMGHGFFYAEGETGDRASPIHAQEIRSSGWDYIALGHNHVHRDVSQGSVKAAYCGSPVTFLNRKGQALLVRLDGNRSEPVFMSAILFPN